MKRTDTPPGFIVGDNITVAGELWKVIDDTRRFCERLGVPDEAGFTVVHQMTGEWRKFTVAEMTAVLASDNTDVAPKARVGEMTTPGYVDGKLCALHPDEGRYRSRRCPACERERKREYRRRLYAGQKAGNP